MVWLKGTSMTIQGMFSSAARFSYHLRRVLQMLLQVMTRSGRGTRAAGELARASGVLPVMASSFSSSI